MNDRFLISFLILSIVPGVWAAPPPAPDGHRWELDERFSDDFNGNSLNTNKWFDHFPGWKGRPPAKFMPNTVSVTNGCLQLRARMLSEADGPFTIAGGAVVSRSSEAFYGYYEARMKASKISMSSTFWLNNKSSKEGDAGVSHELDINETVGAPHPEPAWAEDWNRFMNSNTHYFRRHKGEKENLAKPGKASLDPPSGEAFHVYGAWWVDANSIRFYLNDVYQFTLHPSTKYSSTPFNRSMHVNMVMETYDWQLPPSAADLRDDTRNATLYDWVRGYRLVRADNPDRAP